MNRLLAWGLVLGVCLAVVVIALLVAAGEDLRSRTIPNGCPVAVASSWLIAVTMGGVLDPGLSMSAVPILAPWQEGLVGSVTILGFLLLCDVLARWLFGSGGVGGGDVKLLGALGLWAGLVPGLAMTALACVLAVAGWAVCDLVGRLRRGLLGTSGKAEAGVSCANGVPMAPAISLGFCAAMILRAQGWG